MRKYGPYFAIYAADLRSISVSWPSAGYSETIALQPMFPCFVKRMNALGGTEFRMMVNYSATTTVTGVSRAAEPLRTPERGKWMHLVRRGYFGVW